MGSTRAFNQNFLTFNSLNSFILKGDGAQGIELVTSSPAEFARFVREDNAKWGKIIKDAGIKGD